MRYGRWMSKPPSSMATLRRNCTWYNLRGLWILRMLVKYASFNGPSMDLSKHLGAEIFNFIRSSKVLDLSKIRKNPAFTRK
jgi:hypothetical protein